MKPSIPEVAIRPSAPTATEAIWSPGPVRRREPRPESRRQTRTAPSDNTARLLRQAWAVSTGCREGVEYVVGAPKRREKEPSGCVPDSVNEHTEAELATVAGTRWLPSAL